MADPVSVLSKVKSLEVVDRKFTPTEGDSAGREITYKRIALALELNGVEKVYDLAPSATQKSIYDLLPLADEQ